MYISLTMSLHILQNLSESMNYFRETKSIRTVILINFTDNIIIKTAVWENQFETKVKLLCISKTCLYNFDPLKPHFCIVKLGFTGVYIIFLISAQKHRLWY